MNNTSPKEILENIIKVMEKTHTDDWEIDKLVVVLNYINELEKRIDKTIEYIKDNNNYEEGYCDGELMIYKRNLKDLLDILKGVNND